jgi:hypothetical protein
MDRKEFLKKSLQCAAGAGGLVLLSGPMCCGAMAKDAPPAVDPEDQKIHQQYQFVSNWTGDLLGAMDKELDEATWIKLMDACGAACYHRFKEFITKEAGNDMEKLIQIYRDRWVHDPESVKRKGDIIEITYRISDPNRCTCPVSYLRPPKGSEMRCHCSAGSIKAIFSAVAGRPLKVDLVKSARRGDGMCRFHVHLA